MDKSEFYEKEERKIKGKSLMIRLNDTVFSRENFYEMHCNY